jgi:hypothetical protein
MSTVPLVLTWFCSQPRVMFAARPLAADVMEFGPTPLYADSVPSTFVGVHSVDQLAFQRRLE